MKTNKLHVMISLSFVLLLISCASMTQTITQPTEWKTTKMKKVDFRYYYDNNLLHPIEGIWTYSQNMSWVNVISGLRGSEEEAAIYRIAVIRDENSVDSYNGYILESKRSEWTLGRLKVRYRKTAHKSIYEENWYMRDYSQESRNIVIDDDGIIRYTKNIADYPINYENEIVQLKVYPMFSGDSKTTISTDVKTTGSGFLISEEGLVITNYHVIENANRIEIAFPNVNLTMDASLRIKDVNNDLAILEVDDFDFSAISNDNIPYSLAAINDVRVGQEVFTLGFPLGSIMGSKSRLSTGRINSIYGIQDDPRLFQIGVPLQPGNSGGPLFNMKSELVGIVVSGLNAKYFYDNLGVIPQNVNFAVKVSYLENLLGMLPGYDDLSNHKSDISLLEMEDQVERLNPIIVQIRVY